MFRRMEASSHENNKDWKYAEKLAGEISVEDNVSIEKLIEVKSKNTNYGMNLYLECSDHIFSSWECRDCSYLSDEEYFQKKSK